MENKINYELMQMEEMQEAKRRNNTIINGISDLISSKRFQSIVLNTSYEVYQMKWNEVFNNKKVGNHKANKEILEKLNLDNFNDFDFFLECMGNEASNIEDEIEMLEKAKALIVHELTIY